LRGGGNNTSKAGIEEKFCTRSENMSNSYNTKLKKLRKEAAESKNSRETDFSTRLKVTREAASNEKT
jgi:hypothetical protein